jgi:hypothetical protein
MWCKALSGKAQTASAARYKQHPTQWIVSKDTVLASAIIHLTANSTAARSYNGSVGSNGCSGDDTDLPAVAAASVTPYITICEARSCHDGLVTAQRRFLLDLLEPIQWQTAGGVQQRQPQRLHL